jgi:3D (Asp-Asp-Asp) domain-containing protein
VEDLPMRWKTIVSAMLSGAVIGWALFSGISPAGSRPEAPWVGEALTQANTELQQAMSLLQECFGAPVELSRVRTLPVTLTAYSSTEDQCDEDPHITASNKPVRNGIIAVSHDLMVEWGLTFGQRVLIPGHGLYEVQDRMNRRWQRKVDIWHNDREAARLFGRQKGVLIWIANEILEGSESLATK